MRHVRQLFIRLEDQMTVRQHMSYLDSEGMHHHEIESIIVGQQLAQLETLQLHSLKI